MHHETTTLPDPTESAVRPGAPASGATRLRLERQLQILGELAEIGLELARAVEAESKGPEADLDRAVLDYARVSRAVRQTIMLQSRLIEALDGRQAARAGRRASAARILGEVIEDEGGDKERSERLRAEAAERLEDEDFGDLDSRSLGEAVAGICRDLGLSPDWLRLAKDCFEAQAALDGKPAAPPDEDYDGPLEVRWLSPDMPAHRSDSS